MLRIFLDIFHNRIPVWHLMLIIAEHISTRQLMWVHISTNAYVRGVTL